MNKNMMIEALGERFAVNKQRILCYKDQKNLDGTPISRGHAATALSNARKEQLIVELLIEVVTQCPQDKITLSEKALEGFNKITEPQERHFKRNQYGARTEPMNLQLADELQKQKRYEKLQGLMNLMRQLNIGDYDYSEEAYEFIRHLASTKRGDMSKHEMMLYDMSKDFMVPSDFDFDEFDRWYEKC